MSGHDELKALTLHYPTNAGEMEPDKDGGLGEWVHFDQVKTLFANHAKQAVAELERATKRLCACGDCGGRGEVYSGHSTSQGYNQPPEPDMDVCGTCGGDGVLGPIEDFEALAAERDHLKSEVERIAALNHAQFGAAIRSNAERDQLKAEVERQAAEIVELKDGNRGLQWAIGEMKGRHKNLHRSLCARFGYVHDEKYWWRDEVSLEEHIAAQIGQLKAEVEALRREIASIKPSPISTDKTTIGYTGCVICGQYADHWGLQCPKLAARSLSMENQRVVPVEPIRVPHPLDVATSAPVAVVMPTPCKVKK